jgi:hypothetical protein
LHREWVKACNCPLCGSRTVCLTSAERGNDG